MKTIFTILFACLTSFCINAQTSFPDIDGWKKSDKKVYNSESLWEYINGAADYYLNYGFVEMEKVEYSLSDENYIKAEVYNHATPLNAFGIYAYERSSNGEFLEVGSEGYLLHTSLNFYGDKFYVKVHSNQSDANTLKTIRKIAGELGRAININAENKNDNVFSEFPAQNKLDRSEKYFPHNFLGYEFLHSALEVSYKEADDKFKLFVIDAKDGTEATKMVQSYLDYIESKEEPAQGKIVEIADMFNGLVLMQINGAKIYGVYDTDNKPLAKKYIGELTN